MKDQAPTSKFQRKSKVQAPAALSDEGVLETYPLVSLTAYALNAFLGEQAVADGMQPSRYGVKNSE